MRTIVTATVLTALHAAANAEPRVALVSGVLDCAVATADASTGKSGGGKTSALTVTCTAANRGRAWECGLLPPGPDAKEQHWIMSSMQSTASDDTCDVTRKSIGCYLHNDSGSLYLAIAVSDRKGVMNLRLDLDPGRHVMAIAAKVCAGSVTVK